MANMRVKRVEKDSVKGDWAVVYGDYMVRPAPDLPMRWSRREDLVSALNALRVSVARNGAMTSMNETS